MVFDPIVDEVHKIREKLLDECGGDLSAYMERIREREKEHRHRLVSSVEKAEGAAPVLLSDLTRSR
jgi:hypothetical protein